MTRIDRYILFLYFRILIICFCSIVGLLVIVDVFTNLEEFIESGKQQGSVVKVLVDYFGPKTLSLFEYISGLLAMMAMMFVISWLYRTNELTALLAAGVTKRRVVRPLVVASTIIILAAVLVREIGVPQFQEKLDRKPQDLTGQRPLAVQTAFDQKLGARFYGQSLLVAKRQILKPSIRLSKSSLVSAIGRRLEAETATHLPATNEHAAGYLLLGVTVPADIDSIPSVASSEGQSELLTHRDHAWIEAGGCFFASDLDFELLRGYNKRYASTLELVSFLRASPMMRGDDLRVSIHSRILRPLIDWTVVLLGIPIVLSRPDRNMFWVAGVCLLLVAGFTALVLGLSTVAGTGYLMSPFLAAWLPIVIVLPWSATQVANACDC